MRNLAHLANRKVVATAAVTTGVIGVLSTAAIAVSSEKSPEQQPAGFSHVAESSTADSSESSTAPSSPDAPTLPADGPPPEPVALELDHSAPGPLGVPGIAMRAYQQAADRLAIEQPQCAIPWTLIAGIGQVESQHGTGKFHTDGTTVTKITGPRLDGTIPGTATIADSDGGRLDGDSEFDRAVGPVQFLPSTWRIVGRDATEDGFADPNNIFDSALSTATLLCSLGGSMGDDNHRTQAILGYNNSLAYVANVTAWAHGYEVGEYPKPEDLPPIHPDRDERIPEQCPEGTEGTPSAAPENTDGAPVPGCQPVEPEADVPADPPPPAPVEVAPPAPEPVPEEVPAAPPAGGELVVPNPPPPPPPAGLLPCIAPFCTP